MILARSGYYLDSTHLIRQLEVEGPCCFPRRQRWFGRSPLPEALGTLSQGRRELYPEPRHPLGLDTPPSGAVAQLRWRAQVQAANRLLHDWASVSFRTVCSKLAHRASIIGSGVIEPDRANSVTFNAAVCRAFATGSPSTH